MLLQKSSLITPKINVIIPTYNRAIYICDAIESVLTKIARLGIL